MKCYVCAQTVIPMLEFGENKTFRFVCPCCSSATAYKEDLAEIQNNFCEGYVFNDEITPFNWSEKIKQKVEQYISR